MKNIWKASLCICWLSACTLNLPDPIGDDVERFMPNVKYDKHSVYTDSNKDGVVSSGDTIGLQVWLKNTGLSGANYVKATFSTTSQYVTSFTPKKDIKYGTIPAEASKMVGHDGYRGQQTLCTIQFGVSPATPVDTLIPIYVSVVGSNDRTWKDTFNVTVSNPSTAHLPTTTATEFTNK
ncbi:MAG: hypothetical protein LBJ57_05035 [Prevotellaceae bacterium]|jgi:hypothetical protein|nr:hypothetical protein [Prevotellaceae bacterium]